MPIINARLFAHIENDAELTGTCDLEGNQFIDAISYLSQYLKICHENGEVFPAAYENILQEAAYIVKIENQTEVLKNNLNPTRLAQLTTLADTICTDMDKLPVGGKMLLPGGWTAPSGGHAMIYQVTRTPTGLDFTVVNAGKGLKYHAKKSSRDKELYNPIKKWHIPIPEGDKQTWTKERSLFIERLIEARLPRGDLNQKPMDDEALYNDVFAGISRIGGVEVDANQDAKPHWYTGGQLSGTCTQRSIHQMLKMNSKDLTEYRHFIFKFKIKALKEYADLCFSQKAPFTHAVAHQIQVAIYNNLKILNTLALSKEEDQKYFSEIIGVKTQLKERVSKLPKNDVSPKYDLIDNFTIKANVFEFSRVQDDRRNYNYERSLPIDLGNGLNLIQNLNSITNNINDANAETAYYYLEQLIASLPINHTPNEPPNSFSLPFYKELNSLQQFQTFKSILDDLQYRLVSVKKNMLPENQTSAHRVLLLTIMSLQMDTNKAINTFKNLPTSNHITEPAMNALIGNSPSDPFWGTHNPVLDRRLVELKKRYETIQNSPEDAVLDYYKAILAKHPVLEADLKIKYQAVYGQSPDAKHVSIRKQGIEALYYLSECISTRGSPYYSYGYYSDNHSNTCRTSYEQITQTIDYEKNLASSIACILVRNEGVNNSILKLDINPSSNKTSCKTNLDVQNLWGERQYLYAWRQQYNHLENSAASSLGKKNGSNESQLSYLGNQTSNQNRDYFHLRVSTELQIPLTLDYFTRNIALLAKPSNQNYVEANLFQPGLLEKASLNKELIPQLDNFLKLGIQFHSKNGQHTPESLYFIKLDHQINSYLGLIPNKDLALTRLRTSQQEIQKQLQLANNLEATYTLHEALILNLMKQIELGVRPETVFSSALTSLIYLGKNRNPEFFKSDLPYKMNISKALSCFRQMTFYLPRDQRQSVVVKALKDLGIIFPPGSKVIDQYPNYTLIHSNSKTIVTFDIYTGRLYEGEFARGYIPRTIENHPLLKRLGLADVKECLISSDQMHIKLSQGGSTITLEHNRSKNTLTVQKSWNIEGVESNYQLQALSKRHETFKANPQLNVVNTNLAKVLTDFNMDYWVDTKDPRQGILVKNNIPLYSFSNKGICALDKQGKNTGYQLTPLNQSLLQYFGAFEDSNFLLHNSNHKESRVKLPRYNLAFAKSHNSTEMISKQTGERLVTNQKPVHPLVASLVLENDAKQVRCLIPVARFYASGKAKDASDFHPIVHDIHGTIADAYLAKVNPNSEVLLWSYDNSEKYISYQLKNGEPIADTPANALYLAYIYLSTNQPDKAWKILEECTTRLGGLTGKSEELKYLSWICNDVPYILPDKEQKQRNTPPYVACKLKAIALITDYSQKGGQFDLKPPVITQRNKNEVYASAQHAQLKNFFNTLPNKIGELYERMQKMRRHLDSGYILSFDERKSLLNYNGISTGSLGYERMQLNLETLLKERNHLLANQSALKELGNADKKRLDFIEQHLKKLAPVVAKSTKLELVDIDLRLRGQYIQTIILNPKVKVEISQWMGKLPPPPIEKEKLDNALKALVSNVSEDEFIRHFPAYYQIAMSGDVKQKEILRQFCTSTLIAHRHLYNEMKPTNIPHVCNVLYRILENPSRLATEVSYPAAKRGKQAAEISKLALEMSKLAPEMDKPAAEMSRIVVEMNKLVAEMNKPSAEMNKLVTEMNKLLAEMSKLVAEMTKPAVDASKSIAEMSKLVAEMKPWEFIMREPLQSNLAYLAYYDIATMVSYYNVTPLKVYQVKDVYKDILATPEELATKPQPIQKALVVKKQKHPDLMIQTGIPNYLAVDEINQLQPIRKKFQDLQSELNITIKALSDSVTNSTERFAIEEQAGRLRLELAKAKSKEASDFLKNKGLVNSTVSSLDSAEKEMALSIENAWSKALELAKRGPKSPADARKWRIEQEANTRPILTKADLIALYCQADTANSIEKTGLDPDEVQQLHELIHDALFKGIQRNWLKKIKDYCDIAVKGNDPTQAAMALDLLALSEIPGLDYPATVLIQHEQNIVLHDRQVASLQALLEPAKDGKPFNEMIDKTIPGGGKSKVILPIIAEKKATGTNLVVMEVPRYLLATNTVDLNRESYRLFRKRAYSFDFNRNSDTSVVRLEQIYNMLTEIMINKAYLVTTGEAIQSLELKYLELLSENKINDANWQNQVYWLDKITGLFLNHADCIIDEAHQGLSIKKKLNYTVGAPESISTSEIRSSIALYNFIDVEFIKNAPNLDPNYDWQPFKNQLAMKLLTELNSPLYQFVQDARARYGDEIIDELASFLTNKATREHPVITTATADIKTALGLFKQEINVVLPQTLIRKLGSQYGASKQPGLSALEKTVAIPYDGNDTPNERSRFGNTIEGSNYLIQMMLLQGCSEGLIQNQLKEWLIQARKELFQNPELEGIDKTFIGTSFSALTGGLELSDINPDNAEDLALVHEKLKHNRQVINQQLEYALKQVKREGAVLHSDSFNHVDMYRTTQGVSGTPNPTTYHQRLGFDHTVSLGTDGLIINRVLDKKTATFSCDCATISDFLEASLSASDDHARCRAIIDINATFTGKNNEEVAEGISEFVLKYPKRFSKEIKHILYFNKYNILCALNPAKPKEPIVIGTSDPDEINLLLGSTPDERFTYYDQAHTVGTDIKQGKNSHALVLVDNKTSLQSFVQGCMRMRDLALAQTLELIVPTRNKTMTTQQLITQFAKNDTNDLYLDNMSAAIAQLHNCIRRNLLTRIQALPPENVIEKAALTQKFKSFLFDIPSKDLFAMYGGISKEQTAEHIFNRCATQLLAGWQSCLKEANLTPEKSAVDAMDASLKKIITSALPNCLPKYLDRDDSLNLEVEVAIQKEVQKEIQTEKHTQPNFNEMYNKHPMTYLSWQSLADPFSNPLIMPPVFKGSVRRARVQANTQTAPALAAAPAPVPISMTPSLNTLCGFPNDKPLFSQQLKASSNYAYTYFDQKEMIGAALKPVFLIWYHLDSNKVLQAIIITPEEAEELTKTSHMNTSWISTSQDVLISGTRPENIFANESYRSLREQVNFFNGEFNLLLNKETSFVWLKENSDEKMKFYAEKLFPWRQANRQELNSLQNALKQDASKGFIYIAQNPFADFSHFDWTTLDPQMVNTQRNEYKKMAGVFHYLNTNWMTLADSNTKVLEFLQTKYELPLSSLGYLTKHVATMCQLKRLFEVFNKPMNRAFLLCLNADEQKLLEQVTNVNIKELLATEGVSDADIEHLDSHQVDVYQRTSIKVLTLLRKHPGVYNPKSIDQILIAAATQTKSIEDLGLLAEVKDPSIELMVSILKNPHCNVATKKKMIQRTGASFLIQLLANPDLKELRVDIIKDPRLNSKNIEALIKKNQLTPALALAILEHNRDLIDVKIFKQFAEKIFELHSQEQSPKANWQPLMDLLWAHAIAAPDRQKVMLEVFPEKDFNGKLQLLDLFGSKIAGEEGLSQMLHGASQEQINLIIDEKIAEEFSIALWTQMFNRRDLVLGTYDTIFSKPWCTNKMVTILKPNSICDNNFVKYLKPPATKEEFIQISKVISFTDKPSDENHLYGLLMNKSTLEENSSTHMIKMLCDTHEDLIEPFRDTQKAGVRFNLKTLYKWLESPEKVTKEQIKTAMKLMQEHKDWSVGENYINLLTSHSNLAAKTLVLRAYISDKKINSLVEECIEHIKNISMKSWGTKDKFSHEYCNKMRDLIKETQKKTCSNHEKFSILSLRANELKEIEKSVSSSEMTLVKTQFERLKKGIDKLIVGSSYDKKVTAISDAMLKVPLEKRGRVFTDKEDSSCVAVQKALAMRRLSPFNPLDEKNNVVDNKASESFKNIKKALDKVKEENNDNQSLQSDNQL